MAFSSSVSSVLSILLVFSVGCRGRDVIPSSFRTALESLNVQQATSSRVSDHEQASVRQEADADVIDSEIQALLDQGSGGASVIVNINGTTVKNQAYGLSDVENLLPMTTNSRTNIASVTKQFTTFMIVLLAQRGDLSLEDDVRKYVPELPDYGNTIRLRHMIAMTSGLRDIFVLVGLSGSDLAGPMPRERLIKLITLQDGVRFQPDEQWEYSNSNYVLMSLIVERVTGMSFREALQENIFIPLNMTETSVYDDPTRIFANLSQSYSVSQYVPAPGEASLTAVRNSKWLLSAIGTTGIITTATDLLKWAQNFENNVLGGGQELIETMEAPYVFANASDVTYATGGQYAKGIFIREVGGVTVLEHTGSVAGYRSVLLRIPELKTIVIVLGTTSAFGGVYELSLKIAQSFHPSLATADGDADSGEEAGESTEPDESPEAEDEDVPIPEPKIASLSPQAYRQKAGVWSFTDELGEFYFDMITNCTDEDPAEMECNLLVSFGSLSETYLRPQSELVWVAKLQGQNRAITFTFDQPETVQAVVTLVTAELDEPIEVVATRDPALQLTSGELSMYEGLYFSKELDAVFRAVRVGNGLEFGVNAGIVATPATSYLPCCAGTGFNGTFVNARPNLITLLSTGFKTVVVLEFSHTSNKVEMRIDSSAPRSNFQGVVFRNFDMCAAEDQEYYY